MRDLKTAFTCFPFAVRNPTAEYPFIKYDPILTSRETVCAMICTPQGASTADFQHRAASGAAMTGNGDNETPAQSQSERFKPPQAMRAADSDPAGDETSVEPVPPAA